MKIPKSITVLGRKITIHLVDSEKLRELTGMGAVGACDYSGKKIYILKDMSREDQILTLFHETAHAIQSVVGLNQITTPDLIEIWCESMANGFMDLAKAVR